jgi:hypothetical protein
MPRYCVLADAMQFDYVTTQATLNELVRVDPECEAKYELQEGGRLVVQAGGLKQRDRPATG